MKKEIQIESKMRILLMLTGILFIGLCVSFLRLAGFGVDPFSGMNLGISGFIGWTFGNWQLVINVVLLIVVFFTVRHCIGMGTLINMIFVGYIADFICWLANDVVQIHITMPVRIIALFIGQLMASMGVALYMTADMGIAPYDAVAVIIEKGTKGYYDEKMDNFYIIGTLTNNSSDDYDYVTINYHVSDKDGNILGNATDSIDNLEKGKSWKFKVVYENVDAKEVKNFKINNVSTY